MIKTPTTGAMMLAALKKKTNPQRAITSKPFWEKQHK